jgi:hypothetical protein
VKVRWWTPYARWMGGGRLTLYNRFKEGDVVKPQSCIFPESFDVGLWPRAVEADSTVSGPI